MSEAILPGSLLDGSDFLNDGVQHLGHFFVWYLLDIFTLGILGIFYVSPYYYAAQTEVYRHLRECALAEGIATPEDLPGLPPPIPPERSLP